MFTIVPIIMPLKGHVGRICCVATVTLNVYWPLLRNNLNNALFLIVEADVCQCPWEVHYDVHFSFILKNGANL